MTSKLKAPPRVARNLSGPGRLPSLENLASKSPDELIKTLARFGIEPDVHAIDQRAQRAFQRIERMMVEGVEPDEATWADIQAQHEREMTQTLRQMTKQAIRLYRQDQLIRGAEKLVWITSGKDNVCPSCEPRHGQSKPLAQWRKMGLPGSSGLICRQECNCRLLPES